MPRGFLFCQPRVFGNQLFLGHKTNTMLDRYIRDARLFHDNPLEGLF
jgi:hypothetical protein